jgi:4a-hydroxytetrahydrobiopterin dehydratase
VGQDLKKKRVAARAADARLRDLPGWRRAGKTIRKTFALKGFSDALGLVARVGAIAASWDHHPDVVEIRYNEVTIAYTTHDAGGLTEMDFAVAASIEGQGEAI